MHQNIDTCGWEFPQGSEYQELIHREMIFLLRDKDWWGKHVKSYLGRVVLFSSD